MMGRSLMTRFVLSLGIAILLASFGLSQREGRDNVWPDAPLEGGGEGGGGGVLMEGDKQMMGRPAMRGANGLKHAVKGASRAVRRPGKTWAELPKGGQGAKRALQRGSWYEDLDENVDDDSFGDVDAYLVVNVEGVPHHRQLYHQPLEVPLHEQPVRPRLPLLDEPCSTDGQGREEVLETMSQSEREEFSRRRTLQKQNQRPVQPMPSAVSKRQVDIEKLNRQAELILSSPAVQMATDRLKSDLNLTDIQVERVKEAFKTVTKAVISASRANNEGNPQMRGNKVLMNGWDMRTSSGRSHRPLAAASTNAGQRRSANPLLDELAGMSGGLLTGDLVHKAFGNVGTGLARQQQQQQPQGSGTRRQLLKKASTMMTPAAAAPTQKSVAASQSVSPVSQGKVMAAAGGAQGGGSSVVMVAGEGAQQRQGAVKRLRGKISANKQLKQGRKGSRMRGKRGGAGGSGGRALQNSAVVGDLDPFGGKAASPTTSDAAQQPRAKQMMRLHEGTPPFLHWLSGQQNKDEEQDNDSGETDDKGSTFRDGMQATAADRRERREGREPRSTPVERMQNKWLDRAEGMLLSRQAAGFNAMQHAVGGIVAAGMAEGDGGFGF